MQALDDSDGADTNLRWEAVAVQLPNKSVEACRQRYQSMVEDISNIEAGKVVCSGRWWSWLLAWSALPTD